MARSEINRSGEMEVFVAVVEQGGFSAAARACRMTPSAVSKLVARLETRLGTRLVNRSTRAFQLTPEGCAFYERATRILADIEDAERSAGAGEQPVGRIRLNTSASYATHVLAPILPEFLERNPGVTIDLIQTDLVVDLLSERTDVAVRAGPLKSSSLVARKLGDSAMVVVGAATYLDRFGKPKTIEDLDRHNRLGFGYVRSIDGWPMKRDSETLVIPDRGAHDGKRRRSVAPAGARGCRACSSRRVHGSRRYCRRASRAGTGGLQPRRSGDFPRHPHRPGWPPSLASTRLARFPRRTGESVLTFKPAAVA